MRNNMNNDDETYLWDQSGEPDSEIQELERVLGTLRYQPRPLVIPDDLQTIGPSRWNFGPRLAIAATILLAVGAAALWLSLERRDAPELTATTKPAAVSNSDRAAVTVPDDVLSEIPGSVPGIAPGNVPVSVGTPNDLNERGENARLPPNHRVNPVRRNRYNQAAGIENTNRKRVAEPATPVLAGNELKEAEAGKAKLMLALRVASAKLNVALRKAQGTNNGNQIHNQHKIG